MPTDAHPNFDAAAPVLVLSPHYDDAVFDCWSVIADPEQDVVVVNVFGGVPQPGFLALGDRDRDIRDSAQLVATRRAEDAAALALVGRTALDLEILEYKYRNRQVRIPRWIATFARRPGRRAVNLPFGTDLATIGARVEAAIVDIGAAWSMIFAPAGIGGHPDHHVTRDVALRIAQRSGIPVRLYADLPYACADGWPSWMERREDAPAGHAVDLHDLDDVEREWTRTARPRADMPGWRSATVVALDPATAARKHRAVQRYESQLGALDAVAGNRMGDPATWRLEAFWNAPSS
jgi:LmbE family N-acetylglucosaminyl deacetylase